MKSFERVERHVHERFVAAEREALGRLLVRFYVDVSTVEIGSLSMYGSWNNSRL